MSYGLVAYSNYIPSILDIEIVTNLRTYGNKKLFRFEAIWIGNEECKKIIEKHWNRRVTNAPMESMLHCLHQCGDSLK